MNSLKRLKETFEHAHDLWGSVMLGASVDHDEIRKTLSTIKDLFNDLRDGAEYMSWNKRYCALREMEISRLCSVVNLSPPTYFDPSVDPNTKEKRSPWEFIVYQAARYG